MKGKSKTGLVPEISARLKDRPEQQTVTGPLVASGALQQDDV